MGDIIKMGALSLWIMALSACTTTRPYNLIDPEARAIIKDVDSVLISTQDHVSADINVSRISKYVQGHFVPVLIDIGLNSLRTYKANKIMVPIHETLGEYDFTQEIHSQFNQALQNSRIEGLDEVKLIREEPAGFKAAFLRQSEADAVMFINVKYAFTPKFDALNLTSHIMVMPVNAALSPYKERPDTDDIIELEDNIYRNQFLASVVPVEMIGSKDENGALWAEMSDEELSGRMQKAAKKLALAIAHDLSLDDVDEDALQEEGEDVPEKTVRINDLESAPTDVNLTEQFTES